MLAGMGFRFYWATEALPEEQYAFRPGEDARSIGETVEHIWDLLHWMYCAIDPTGTAKPNGAEPMRAGVLELIVMLEAAFLNMQPEALAAIHLLKEPFWPVLNGPLADVLTHIGQLTTLRRIAGFPVAESNPFEGTPPPGR
jgi:hypothetical protein